VPIAALRANHRPHSEREPVDAASVHVVELAKCDANHEARCASEAEEIAALKAATAAAE
jgi:hypothetical protein